MLEQLKAKLAAQYSPRWIAETLLTSMKGGITAAELADKLARVPGIQNLLGDQTPAMFYSRIMDDPQAKKVVHPFDRAALRQFISDVLRETRARLIL